MRCFLHCYKKRRRGICFSGTVSITEPEEDDRRSALLEKKKKKRRLFTVRKEEEVALCYC